MFGLTTDKRIISIHEVINGYIVVVDSPSKETVEYETREQESRVFQSINEVMAFVKSALA